jgi:peptide/nickel transport system substrate-binding protein
LGVDFPLKPVGTGPFQLAAFKPDQEILLRRNPDYRPAAGRRAPAVEEVRLILTRDANAAFAAYSSGKSDFLVLDLPGLTRIRRENATKAAHVESSPTARFQFYLFNLKTVADSETRRAISATVNRQALKKVVGELGTVAQSIFPPAIFPELAVPRAELSITSPQPAASKPLPKQLRLVCFNDTLSRAVAQRLSADLRARGCNLRIEAATFPVLVERLTRGEYDLVQIYWGPMYAEPAHYLGPFLSSQFPPQGNNFNLYKNTSFDASVMAAKATTDASKRQQRFHEAETTLLNDMPLLPLYFENLVRASNGKFSLPLHPLYYRRYQSAQPQ